MTRRKNYKSNAESISAFLHQNSRKQLTGQTNKRHYLNTKDNTIECSLYAKSKSRLERHRIIPNGEYEDKNIIIVCVPCHQLIHHIYKETNAQNEEQFRLAILLAKLEVS